MAKKYYGKEGKKMSAPKGFAGLPQKEVMKAYPAAPIGGNMGKYRDSQPESDAYGRMCVNKLKKQKAN